MINENEEQYFSKRKRREKQVSRLSKNNKHYAYAYYKLYQDPSGMSQGDWHKNMIQDFNL